MRQQSHYLFVGIRGIQPGVRFRRGAALDRAYGEGGMISLRAGALPRPKQRSTASFEDPAGGEGSAVGGPPVDDQPLAGAGTGRAGREAAAHRAREAGAIPSPLLKQRLQAVPPPPGSRGPWRPSAKFVPVAIGSPMRACPDVEGNCPGAAQAPLLERVDRGDAQRAILNDEPYLDLVISGDSWKRAPKPSASQAQLESGIRGSGPGSRAPPAYWSERLRRSLDRNAGRLVAPMRST